jgi:hypothetical protein
LTSRISAKRLVEGSETYLRVAGRYRDAEIVAKSTLPEPLHRLLNLQARKGRIRGKVSNPRTSRRLLLPRLGKSLC